MRKIMKVCSKITALLLLLMLIIYSLPDDITELFYVKAYTHGFLTEIRDIIIVGINKNKNNNALNECLKKKFGHIIYDTIEITEKYRYRDEMFYSIKMPFIDESFSVGVTNGDITTFILYTLFY